MNQLLVKVIISGNSQFNWYLKIEIIANRFMLSVWVVTIA